jgi:mannose-6-phosphate isomerase-like protein (cupin superfamily)
LVKFEKIEEMEIDSRAFDSLVDYRHFYSSDTVGKHSPGDYEKGGERYEQGYTIARFSKARKWNKKDESWQPYHSHIHRDLFLIGVKGKRTMIIEDKKYEIVPGTYVYIGPGERHKTLRVGNDTWENIEIWRAHPHDDEHFFESLDRAKAKPAKSRKK